MRLVTNFNPPPIPIRNFDWSAYDGDTYDCDCDQDVFYSTSPVGHGATEADAIADLMEQTEDEFIYPEQPIYISCLVVLVLPLSIALASFSIFVSPWL